MKDLRFILCFFNTVMIYWSQKEFDNCRQTTRLLMFLQNPVWILYSGMPERHLARFKSHKKNNINALPFRSRMEGRTASAAIWQRAAHKGEAVNSLANWFLNWQDQVQATEMSFLIRASGFSFRDWGWGAQLLRRNLVQLLLCWSLVQASD